jgi:hypothetical protein
VDTLQLVEIGSIQAPAEITELYVEDLDGDSLKEIILCTDYYVYIYNSQTYQVEWTSPPLNNPQDLLFKDINSDGLIDLSVQDSANIHLFDPHTPQTIWTSPELDSTYRCYAIGDRNDDDWIDVAIVSKEPFYRIEDEDNRDTVWINIYDGPSYNLSSTVVITFSNYIIHYGGPRFTKRIEIPSEFYICSLGDISNPIPLMLLFNDINYSTEGVGPNYYYYYGSITVIDGISQNIRYINEIGRFAKGKLNAYNNDMVFNSITYFKQDFETVGYLNVDKHMICSDSILNEIELLSAGSGVGPLYIKWLLYSEVNNNNYGSEIVFAYSDWDYGVDRIYQFGEITGDTLWHIEYQNLGIDAFVINFPALFSESKIMVQIEDQLNNYDIISGENGNRGAVVIDAYGIIETATDFDNDENDEVFSIVDDMLYIYNLENATGIYDNSKLPYRAFLRPNYPNPFNSSTTIEYGLSEPGWVRIDIYDLLGRRVKTLINKEMQAGRHQVIWDASGYSSGVYFYRIEAGDYVDTKRMVYLK